ncbi:MAG: DUF503 domain-containing protein [Chloroflexi bacterium]|nr:DUF503 domain-containing protein [Chloroflexota bacterium]
MIVATCRLQLRLPSNGSLKGKRQTVQSIVAHIRKDFNVAVAEVDTQDSWQLATLGIVTVSTAADHAHGLLTAVVRMVERRHWDVELLDYQIEIL